MPIQSQKVQLRVCPILQDLLPPGQKRIFHEKADPGYEGQGDQHEAIDDEVQGSTVFHAPSRSPAAVDVGFRLAHILRSPSETAVQRRGEIVPRCREHNFHIASFVVFVVSCMHPDPSSLLVLVKKHRSNDRAKIEWLYLKALSY